MPLVHSGTQHYITFVLRTFTGVLTLGASRSYLIQQFIAKATIHTRAWKDPPPTIHSPYT